MEERSERLRARQRRARKDERDMNPKIQQITLEFPNCDDGTILWYKVGKDEVTRINSMIENGYPNIFYQIWKGENLFAELHHFTHIIYFEPDKQ